MKNESPKELSGRMIKTRTDRIIPTARKVGRNMDIARSKNVTHFAPHHTTPTSTIKPTLVRHLSDIGPIKHPMAAKVEKKRLNQIAQPTVQSNLAKPAKVIKEEAINEAFRKLADKQQEQKTNLKRRYKFVNGFSISIVVLMIVAFFVYLYIPVFSMQVASAQAGISATYPEYCPDGYKLNGAISYKDGEVTINFQANSGNSKFAIKQSKSSWDSTAVRNQVSKDSSGEFITTEERGLTIYTYGGNAAWVNGGILYNITGNAPLSGDQIRRIATSL